MTEPIWCPCCTREVRKLIMGKCGQCRRKESKLEAQGLSLPFVDYRVLHIEEARAEQLANRVANQHRDTLVGTDGLNGGAGIVQ